MPDTISSETIETLASKLADFSKGLSSEEQLALDRYFLQSVDSGDDVRGFDIGSNGSAIALDDAGRLEVFVSSLAHVLG